MKKFLTTPLLISEALLTLAFFAPNASTLAGGQQRGANATTLPRPIPRTTWDGKPDLSGVWGPASYGPGPNQDTRTATPEERTASVAELERVYQPWARKLTSATRYQDDPRLHCGPYGFPRYLNIPDYFLLQIVQAPKETVVLVEYTFSGFRVIRTGGSLHPKTLVPSYFGDSIGHWEGDTFVVDVVGFNGKIWLHNPRTFGEGGGWVTSNALHEVERWRLVDADTLEYQATVEDSKVLTGPWTTPKYLLKRAPPNIIPHEALCLEPEDLAHIVAVAEQEKK